VILDLRLGVPSEPLRADVVVVGAGPAGITLALELANSGLEVLVAEAGGAGYDAAGQDFYRAASVEPPTHGPAQMYRRRNLGGSTALWGGRCIPFDPIDVEPRPWMAHATWPIGHDVLARHYPAAAAWCEAGPALFDARAALPGAAAPLVDGQPTGDLVLDRIERFSPPTDFGRRYRDRLAQAPRVRVLLHAPVLRVLSTEGSGAAAGVEVRAGAVALQIAAPRVVLAAGGIETARLLLASDDQRPGGLGNERDLVGRFYQCHLEGEIGRIRFTAPAAAVRADYERSPEGVYCRRYAWLSPAAQRREALAGLLLRPNHANIVNPDHRHAVLSAMYIAKHLIAPEYARKLTALEEEALAGRRAHALRFHGEHLRNMVFGAPGLLAFSAMWARRRVFARRKLPSVFLPARSGDYPLEVNAEQEPNPDSRITLDTARDAHGQRRVRVDWRTTAADHQRLARGLRLMQAAFAVHGGARLDFDGIDLDEAAARRIPVGGHHIGTARMGHSPATGVCDANGELFGTRGVFIAGAAAFPTSGFANPTLTIVALAVRLAQHLARSTVR
jgi:choline dehydrogenase-like flavoprotein